MGWTRPLLATVNGVLTTAAEPSASTGVSRHFGPAASRAQLQRADLSGAPAAGRGPQLQGAVANGWTGWPDGWDQTRIAEAGVQFAAKPKADVGPTGDAAQRGEEQESAGR